MDSAEIIASIKAIYDRFHVPSILRLHMRRTAAIAQLICDHWNGPELDRDLIVSVMLIHDLGNIVKMDLDGSSRLIDELGGDVGMWRERQRHVRAEYGEDDHAATARMAEELDVSARHLSLIAQKTSANNVRTARSDDWELKICAYADQRTGPFGVVSLDERFADLKRRYATRGHPLATGPDRDRLIAAAFAFEEQIFVHTDLSPQDIDDDAISPYLRSHQQL